VDEEPLLNNENNNVQEETPRTNNAGQESYTTAKAKYSGNPDEFELFINDTWERAMGTMEVPKGQENPHKNLVVRRSGWKTIRIFVSSTFKDFHPEREMLVKKVFPDLRNWCESRRLQLIECDLRWVSNI